MLLAKLAKLFRHGPEGKTERKKKKQDVITYQKLPVNNFA